ncbi:hypothetical protein [Nocardioides marmoraquaticus]
MTTHTTASSRPQAAPHPRPPAPRVVRRSYGQLTIELDNDQAVALARVLAHYDALVHQTWSQLSDQILVDVDHDDVPALASCRDYQPDTWQPVTVSLLTLVAGRLGLLPPPPSGVSQGGAVAAACTRLLVGGVADQPADGAVGGQA